MLIRTIYPTAQRTKYSRYKVQQEIIQSRRTISTMFWTTRLALALLGVLCILNSLVLVKSVPASMTENQSSDNPTLKEAMKILEKDFSLFETGIINEIRSLLGMLAVSGP
ncbi:spider silk-constituting element SpiCE-NMa5 [Trichonephila clavata]|uniref:Spider silk-constituting element SpiCE-NMa5 n=1 Tax=Trichonephila clavata TaxID=2740835 RepID=A0A8X6K9F1_TRICU|nr:spider silk-constituting element SpiCE-NMa5 [Trichonephila clavata]